MKYKCKPYKISLQGNAVSIFSLTKHQLSFCILFTVLLYARLVFNDFVYYDDDVLIINNEFIKNLNVQTFLSSFGFSKIVHYHPLVYISYSVEYLLFGLNPAYYHLTNILLHAVNVYLLFLVLKKADINQHVSMLTVLFFAFHPLHVESVAWVTERKDLLYTLFYFGAIILHISYSQNKHKKYYIGSLFLFSLSCLSKSMAVTLPIVLALIDFYMKRDAKKSFKQYLPYLFISLIISIINLKVAYFNANLSSFSLSDTLILTCYALLFYPFKVIFPVHLSAIYPYPDSITWLHYSAAFVFLIITIMFFVYSRNKLFKFGVLFYLFTIIPVLPLVPFGISLTADRYVYMPSIGLFLIFSALIYNTNSILSEKITNVRNVYIAFVAIIVISMAVMTFSRCAAWQNTETLMRNALSYNNKNYYGYFILGNYYSSSNSYQNAVTNYEECIRLKPEFSDAILNLGNAYFQLSDFKKAGRCFSKVIEINPTDKEAYNNLGVVFESSGEFEKAIKNYKVAASLGYEPANEVLKYYGVK